MTGLWLERSLDSDDMQVQMFQENDKKYITHKKFWGEEMITTIVIWHESLRYYMQTCFQHNDSMMDDEMTPRNKESEEKICYCFFICVELIILSIYSLWFLYSPFSSPMSRVITMIIIIIIITIILHVLDIFSLGAAQHEQIMNMIGRRKRLSKIFEFEWFW